MAADHKLARIVERVLESACPEWRDVDSEALVRRLGLLVGIAHPNFQNELGREARRLYHV